MTKEDAEKLSLLLLQISAKLDQSIAFVRDKDSTENFEIFRKGAGQVMGHLYFNLKEPLWNRFPELLPEQMDGPYKIPPSIYDLKFYEPEN